MSVAAVAIADPFAAEGEQLPKLEHGAHSTSRTSARATEHVWDMNYMTKHLTEEQLIADLHATFPGILAKPACEYRRPEYQRGAWVGGEACIGDLPIFSDLECDDPDEYNGRVLHVFEQWLADRGYDLDCWDYGTYFAVPVQQAIDEAGQP